MSETNEFELLPDQPSKKREPRRRKNMDDYADWTDEPSPRRSGGAGGLIVGLAIGAMVVLAVIGGVMAFFLASQDPRAGDRREVRRSTGPVNAKRGQIGSFTVQGPDGAVQFPPNEVTVVNVFLQACADCMPSFNVYRDCGGFEDEAPVVNLAYNYGSKDWLKDYNMDTNLVLDKGGRFVVNPQGIRKFTTLVVDRDGKIHLRIQPTERDYAEKVRAKIRELQDQ